MDEPPATIEPLPRQKRARLILAAALVILGAWIIHDFLASLAWAAVIAIAISPLYARAERRWPHLRRRALLPAITTLLIAVVVLGPVTLGLSRAVAEGQDLMRWIADARANGIPVPHWLTQLPIARDAAVGWWQQHLTTPEATQAQLARLDNHQIFYQSRQLFKAVLHRSVVLAFTLLALFFILRDGDILTSQLKVASQRLFGPSGERMGLQVVQSVRGTIDGLVLVGIGEGAVMAVAYLALGVPHPLLLGAATAIAAMIPFGAALMFEIAALALLTQDFLTGAILINVIGFAVVGVADHFVRPVLIGGATRLPFLWVLIGILGGVETLGLLGLFVGPATMAVLVMLWREYVQRDLPLATNVD
jgi:predicted PurR-regulated permease PerM